MDTPRSRCRRGDADQSVSGSVFDRQQGVHSLVHYDQKVDDLGEAGNIIHVVWATGVTAAGGCQSVGIKGHLRARHGCMYGGCETCRQLHHLSSFCRGVGNLDL